MLTGLLAFGFGLGAGASIGPVPAARGVAAPEPVLTAPIAPTARNALARGQHPAEVLRVIDGDTFEARVHVWPGLDITTRVRLRSIDAPEMKARCPEEAVRAESARAALVSILGEGDVTILNVGFDKYGGRVLAEAATRATPDVSARLREAGHARAYSGGRRESWCG